MLKKFAVVVAICNCTFLQAQTLVNNLNYSLTQSVISNNGKHVKDYGELNFNWNADSKLLVADKTKNGEQKPRIILDLNKRIIVVQMPAKQEYVLEETDSLFQYHDKLVRTESTQTIGGYNCTEYVYKKDNAIGNAVGRPVFHLEYRVWVTEDLVWDDNANSYLYGLLKGVQPTTADIKGVVMKFVWSRTINGQGEETVYKLDTAMLNRNPEEITWPWETNEGIAWLEGEVPSYYSSPGLGYDGSYHAHYRKGDRSMKKYNERLLALLKRVTGQTDPKTKKWIFEDLFW
ncbi:MAG TPA: hypothetical protein PLW44_08785 [Chitinophagales bacterium]|nr:hypothetical protein [Chitinophagales bacterium]